MESVKLILACLAMMCVLAAGAQGESEAVELPLDSVQIGLIESTESSLQYVIYAPINPSTNQSNPITVTTYVVNQYATTSLESRWPSMYFSLQPQPGPASPNNTISTKSPAQSQVIEAADANYEVALYEYAPAVLVYRFYVGVWCPELLEGDSAEVSISASEVEDLVADRWETVEGSGVYVLEGTLRSGVRRYFAAATLPPSQIIIEVCREVDDSSEVNSIPVSFLFDRFTDVNPDENAVQWPMESCQATYNSASVVSDPTTGADGYLEVCPLYVHFTDTLSPATFALDISYWWNYSPIINGSISYSVIVQTDYMVEIPAVNVEGYDNAQVSGFEMSQSGSDLIVDFVPIHARNSKGDVDPISEAVYTVYADINADEVDREELQYTHLFDSGCFLATNSETFSVTGGEKESSLLASSVYTGHKTITVTGFFEDLEEPASMPYHVNIGVITSRYGDYAYSMQTVGDTDGLTPPPSGLGGWAIFGIVIGSLSVVAVFAGIVGFLGFLLYKRKNSSYEVMP